MSATLLYRIAAVLLVVFALGHTWGFLHLAPASPAAVAVRDAMDHVRFESHGHRFSYGGFYVAFGLEVSIYLLFAACVAWRLGSLAARDARAIGALGWALFAAQAAGLALSWIYFGVPQVAFSGLASVLTGWAAWLAGRR